MRRLGDRCLLRGLLRFLGRGDLARLAVAALEAGRGALAHWLLYGDACLVALDETACLHVAAAEGCYAALAALLEGAKQDKRFTALDGAGERDWRAEAEAVYARVGGGFPPEVLYRAASRGDLALVEWLHAKTNYDAVTATTTAARGRHLEVVQWLVDRCARMTTALRLENSRALGAVCWTYVNSGTHFCTVSAPHGFHEWTLRRADRVAPGYPLGDAFAAAGDIASLEKIAALPSGVEFFSWDALACAADSGDLALMQWMYPLRDWNLHWALRKVISNGHLDILAWLVPLAKPDFTHILLWAVEAGRVDVARWIWTSGGITPEKLGMSYGIKAFQSESLAMMKFLYEECGFGAETFYFASYATIPTIQYVFERAAPSKRARTRKNMVEGAACARPIEVLEYLMSQPGCWSDEALKYAVSRVDGLAHVKLLCREGRRRAALRREPVIRLFSFQGIRFFDLLRRGCMETAAWLIQHVPEIEPERLVGADTFFYDISTRTSRDVFAIDSIRLDDDMVTTAVALNTALVACVRYRPEQARTIKWLPQWFVQSGCPDGFTLCETIEHPELRSQATVQAILKHSRDAKMMATAISDGGKSVALLEIAAWAAKYGHVSLATHLVERVKHEPVATRIGMARRILATARQYGQSDVLKWVHSRAPALLAVDVQDLVPPAAA